MSKHLPLIFLFISQPAWSGDDDFWLMLDAEPVMRSNIQLNAGGNSGNGEYYGLQTSIATDQAQLYLATNRQQFDVETRDITAGIGSNPQNKTSVRVDYMQTETLDELETRDTLLEISYKPNAWEYILGYKQGEIEVLLNPFPSIVIDRSAWHAGLGYSGKLVYGKLEYWDYDYEKRERLSGYKPILRSRLLKMARAQAQSLAKEQIGAGFGLQGVRYGLDVSLNRITSVIHEETSDYLTVSASRKINEQLAVSVVWDRPLEDAAVGLIGVAVNWRW